MLGISVMFLVKRTPATIVDELRRNNRNLFARMMRKVSRTRTEVAVMISSSDDCYAGSPTFSLSNCDQSPVFLSHAPTSGIPINIFSSLHSVQYLRVPVCRCSVNPHSASSVITYLPTNQPASWSSCLVAQDSITSTAISQTRSTRDTSTTIT